MTYLGGRALPLDRDERQRVLHAAKFIEMRDRRVWIHDPRTGTKCEIPPMREREDIVRQALKGLGFPHGHQLYEALNLDIYGWECVKTAYASAREANPDN